MNNYYIYIYLDPRKYGKYCYNNFCFIHEPFYIGKGKDVRYKNHNSRTKIFKNKINKIKQSKLEPIIFKLYENLSENQSFEIEKQLIKEIGRTDLNLGSLVNMTDGGEGSSGVIKKDETKNKISKKHKGKILSEEHKIKLSKSHLGKKLSENHKINIGISNKGRIFSEESKNKIKEKMKGEKNYSSILISQDVIQIKLLLKEGLLTQQEIADIFGVSRQTVSSIRTEKRWSHIKV